VVHVALLFAALWMFLRRFEPGRPLLPVLAVPSILFLWGTEAPLWSGFLDLPALEAVAPYPSTLAAALLFVALRLHLDFVERGSRRCLAGVAILFGLVLLIHPTTCIELACGLWALWLARTPARGRALLRDGAWLALALVASTALALFWPYYPLRDLLLGREGAEFHLASRGLYEDILIREWPLLVWCVPALLVRWWRDRRDGLVLWTLALLAVYLWGAASGRYGVGRVLSFLGVVPQLALASLLAQLIEPRMTVVRAWVCSVVYAAGITLAVLGTESVLNWKRPPYDLAFITRYVGPDDVVLAHWHTSLIAPAFAGKVVGSPHPLYWIPDHEARRKDQDRFFAPTTPAAERREIMARCHPRFLLIDRVRLRASPDLQKFLVGLCERTEENARYALFRVLEP
jgi:alpha-1,6-mannosyltransferase